MSDDDNNNRGDRVNQGSYDQVVRPINEQDAMEKHWSKDAEMTIGCRFTSEMMQTDAPNPNATADTLMPKLSTESHAARKATRRISEDLDMTSESEMITVALKDSSKSRDAVDKPMLSTKPEAVSADISTEVGGTKPTKPSHKRKSDKFTTASDNSSDLPAVKKVRRYRRVTEKRGEAQSARKPDGTIYRGISSGDGTVPGDAYSYSLPNVTLEQQARNEPDFIGEAEYFDLRWEDVR